MASMYETIMELPLFKGIGEEQLSQMLEKTSIEFLKFKNKDIIASEGIQVKNVDFILSGNVRNSYKLENFDVEIEETLGAGIVIGALQLFGLNTNYNSTYIAQGNVSVMRIEKSQYMNILQSDRIYMLNYVNLLAAAAQKAQSIFLSIKEPSILQKLEIAVNSLTTRQAEKAGIRGSDEEIARFCGVSKEEFLFWKNKEATSGKIKIEEDLINIKFRY